MWTNWRRFSRQTLNWCPESPGVYYIRWLNKRGKPAPIGRILGTDPDGTLYIGMTGKGRASGLCNRLWTFWDKASGRQGAHSGAKRFLRNLSEHASIDDLEYCHRQVANRKEALRVEKECLRHYEKKWGELPPLNSAGVKE